MPYNYTLLMFLYIFLDIQFGNIQFSKTTKVVNNKLKLDLLCTSYVPPMYLLCTSYLPPTYLLPTSYVPPMYLLSTSYLPPIYLLSISYLPILKLKGLSWRGFQSNFRKLASYQNNELSNVFKNFNPLCFFGSILQMQIETKINC